VITNLQSYKHYIH